MLHYKSPLRPLLPTSSNLWPLQAPTLPFIELTGTRCFVQLTSTNYAFYSPATQTTTLLITRIVWENSASEGPRSIYAVSPILSVIKFSLLIHRLCDTDQLVDPFSAPVSTSATLSCHLATRCLFVVRPTFTNKNDPCLYSHVCWPSVL